MSRRCRQSPHHTDYDNPVYFSAVRGQRLQAYTRDEYYQASPSMAEPFGVAAGVIGVVSLSIQLAESLQKVKGFYAAVNNAPLQIEELIEEIEIMQDILSDLESGSQSASVASGVNVKRCMKVAQ